MGPPLPASTRGPELPKGESDLDLILSFDDEFDLVSPALGEPEEFVLYPGSSVRFKESIRSHLAGGNLNGTPSSSLND